MLGLIALAGVIINHAIILLDSLLRRLEQDKEKEAVTLSEVIVESSAIRLRPIFLTTITTVVGMIPLAFVSALWGPLAFAIMFGLSFAMVLTLVLIPVFFYRYPGKEYKHLKAEETKHESWVLLKNGFAVLRKVLQYVYTIVSYAITKNFKE
jgi:Cu/Ag efflux pump CusA